MSDDSVRLALRSAAPLVVIEAPAGCGKTHQGAEYVLERAIAEPHSNSLILTHTHAACSVFAERTRTVRSQVKIRTIDSIVAEVGTAYHSGIGVPADTTTWARQTKDGYAILATKVARLLRQYPMIARSLAVRYPVVVCDEHQDSSGDQHAVVMALHEQGSQIRLFGDPVQKIFPDGKRGVGSQPPIVWTDLAAAAGVSDELDMPHRWSKGCPLLGKWILDARTALKNGGRIDLRKIPPSIRVVDAENLAQKPMDYRLSLEDRKPIDAFEKAQNSLLVLTRHNDTARAMRSFFFRRVPLWEGHIRTSLETLIDQMQSNATPAMIASALVVFMSDVGKGFSPTAFGNRFEKEVRSKCAKAAKGMPATLQELARFVLDEPNHKGAAKMLQRLHELSRTDAAFREVQLDCHSEFWDAVRLGDFDSPEMGFAEISQRRTHSHPKPSDRSISTIHKAKGLECQSVLIMPCDAKTFPDKQEARCLLYVALSRAKNNLMIVVSRANPSPLVII